MIRIKYVLVLLCTLFIQWQQIFSQNGNRLYMPDIESGAGKEVSLPIYLTNETEIVAVQMKLHLPFAMTEGAEATLSDRKNDHTLSVRSLGNNDYLFVLFSAKNTSLRGNSGILLRIPMTIPNDCEIGKSYPVTFTQQILSDATGKNVCTIPEESSSTLTIVAEPHPDLAVQNITASPNSLQPGDKLNVTWLVSNIGELATQSGWSEQVTLVAENGETKTLGTLHYNNTVSAGATVSRQATFNLPAYLGLEGNISVEIRLTPNADSGELTSDYGNNAAQSATSVNITRLLSLQLPTVAINESNTASIACKLYRSGSWAGEQTFTLECNAPSRLSIPEKITIPQGQSGTTFYIKTIDNSVLDNDSIITITASGNGYPSISGKIVIEDNEYPALTVTTSGNEINEGETFQLTVETERKATEPITVYLTCDHPKRFTYPAQVTIPAGENSVTVNVTATEDELPDVTISAAFTATAARHNKSESVILLYDNDLPEIELELTPTVINESAGPTAIMATLRRLNHTDNKITVKLTDNSNGSLYYQTTSLTLEAGITEAQFTIGTIDNSIVDGDREITITAAVYISSCSCSASGTTAGVVTRTLTILDDDGPSLKITSSKSMLQEGAMGATVLTVTRNTSVAESLTVAITSDHDDELTYSRTVTIPAGKTSVDVPVTVKNNETSGDDRTVVFTVVANGYTKGTCWVMITDQTLPDAKISEVLLSVSEIEAGGKTDVSITVTNEGAAILPSQTKIKLFLSNSNTSLGSFYTQEAIEPGQSTTVTKAIAFPNVTGDYTLRAVVNEEQTVKELLYINNTYTNVPVKMLPRFTAAVTTDKAIYNQGETININGTATGSAAANTEVEVYIINEGVRQIYSATTDASGHFSVAWKPYANQSGHFAAGACYPNEGLTTEQTSFDIYGLKRATNGYITCETLTGETYQGEIELSNPGKLPLTNVKVELLSVPDNCTAVFEPITEIKGNATASLKYTLTGNAASTGNDWEQLKAHLTTTEGATLDLLFYYYCRSPKGELRADISSINTTMIKGVSRDYPFTITNMGKGATGKITLALPESTWMTAVTPKEMASLEYGESATVILRLTPDEDMQLNVPVTGTIGVNCENGNGIPLSYRIEPVSETTGTLVVDVCDEYTYYTTEAPHVTGAQVVVKHPATGAVVAQGTTGNDGLYEIELPEGYYAINVTADKHDSYSNNVLVDPGKETEETINLSYQGITVDWKVEEIEIEDEYNITTTVKYETNVPMPVVELIIPSELPAYELQAGESLMFYATLTNKGLITAQDVTLLLPEGFNTLSFEALVESPFNLTPQQSITIPVKVTRTIQSASTPQRAMSKEKPLEDDACTAYPGTLYYWDCGNDRKMHKYGKALQLGSCRTDKDGNVIINKPTNLEYSGTGGLYYGGIAVYPTGVPSSNYQPSANKTTPVTKLEETDCVPCQNRFIGKMIMCKVSVPIWSCLKSSWDCGTNIAQGNMTKSDVADCVLTTVGCAAEICETASTVAGQLEVTAVCKIIGKITSWIECGKSLLEPCDLEGSSTIARKRGTNRSITYPSYIEEFQTKAGLGYDQMVAQDNIFNEFFGNKKWKELSNEDLTNLLLYIKRNYEGNKLIDTSDPNLSTVKPEALSEEEFNSFIIRLNNTTIVDNGGTPDNDNYIRKEYILQQVNIMKDAELKAQEYGYESLGALMDAEFKKVEEKLSEASSSVCASITLQFSQSMVMTRQAFRGTLSVFNGNETTAMENVKLSLEVRDEKGNLATSHEFQINAESLDKFTGELNMESGWSLAPNETGVATILFIPTKYAAPTIEKTYSFGGTLSYLDPFTGLEVTRDLYPVTLTVKPSPNLDLTYFMQRDILGDNPLTTDVTEPMIPAEFSLLVNNTGYGDATNVRMTTKQPEIIDNEKGLLINFELLSSQLNGGEQTLALGENIATEFGTIPAHNTAYAQWWIQSSLLGHFTEYDIEATHVTSYGNENLSLLNEVTVHELIHSLKIPTTDENSTLTGFLVNDITDAEDLPDMLYLSDGSIENVAITTFATIKQNSDTEYTLTVQPTASGWNYGAITDPTNGIQTLAGITRLSDGATINLRNFWQTNQTLRDGKDPLEENRLHFADKLGTTAETYILTFNPKPDIVLEVEAFSGTPASGTIANTPLQQITVRFNKPIDTATFTSDDITLNCQGVTLNATAIEIIPVDEQEFVLNLSALTTANGYYVLNIQTAGITDSEGFQGNTGKKIDWIQYADGKVNLLVKATPAEGGTVTPASGIQNYGTTVTLSATAAEGYDFLNWNSNNEIIATTPVCEYVLNGNTTVTATFIPKRYNVVVTCDTEGGSITGGGTGIYEYGQTLTLIAVPSAGYNFEGWNINGTLHETAATTTISITDAITIEAVFTKVEEITLDYSLVTGWNWLSFNVADQNLTDIPAMLAPIESAACILTGQTDDLINDPQYGWLGTLKTLYPERSYKLQMTGNANLSLKGKPFGTDGNTITLQEGWNWVGYLPVTELSLNEALKNLLATTNDVVKGQDSFSMYNGSGWVGSLQTMRQGCGYLFYSQGVKSFNYPTESSMQNLSPIQKVENIAYTADNASSTPWTYDAYRYADNMNIVSQLYASDITVQSGRYFIGAFVGDECRGTSVECNGLQFITIHGETEGENINFRVWDKETNAVYTVKENIPYKSEILGNLTQPLHLTFSTVNVDAQNTGWSIYPNPVRNRLFFRGYTDNIVHIRITDINGVIRLQQENVSTDKGLDVSTLIPGFYFITVQTNAAIVQRKFLKAAEE